MEAPDGTGDGDHADERMKAEPCRGRNEHFVGTLLSEIFFTADESDA
jgi:hypothetical protein